MTIFSNPPGETVEEKLEMALKKIEVLEKRIEILENKALKYQMPNTSQPSSLPITQEESCGNKILSTVLFTMPTLQPTMSVKTCVGAHFNCWAWQLLSKISSLPVHNGQSLQIWVKIYLCCKLSNIILTFT